MFISFNWIRVRKLMFHTSHGYCTNFFTGILTGNVIYINRFCRNQAAHKRSCLVLQNTCGKELPCSSKYLWQSPSVSTFLCPSQSTPTWECRKWWTTKKLVNDQIHNQGKYFQTQLSEMTWTTLWGCHMHSCVIPKMFHFHTASGSQDSSYPLLNVSKMSN